ncbi:hypothetical protein E2C01_025534 [Portunus trituberculatus]|uniref:Uncharacterized protein n=1 Tax=Portunus trituberculatus TaxID=210409 RepID=A0A5B7EG66_PORTR|nr:hypothetical protein [Portunus trituberculatus]
MLYQPNTARKTGICVKLYCLEQGLQGWGRRCGVGAGGAGLEQELQGWGRSCRIGAGAPGLGQELQGWGRRWKVGAGGGGSGQEVEGRDRRWSRTVVPGCHVHSIPHRRARHHSLITSVRQVMRKGTRSGY